MRALRDGEWITRERIRGYSILMLLALIGAAAYLIATSHGPNDVLGRPLGPDFANVYAAGTYARDNNASYAFDPALQFVREQMLFGRATQFYGWHYPPIFLLLARPLADVGYCAALGIWILGTLAFYCCSMKWIIPSREVLLPALGFTAVWVNALNGNNGFLTAALFGGALALLPTRAIAAGVLFGCLAYKPQYGVLIPFALMAGGYWRAIIVAALTVIILCGLSILEFGSEPWSAFFANAEFTRSVVLEQGGTGFYKMQSLFAWVRELGGDVHVAYAVQGIAALVVFYHIIKIWRSNAAYELRAASLLIGTLIVTPYSLDYDLMLLAPAIAFLMRHGQREGYAPYEKSLLFFAAAMPIVARIVAQHSDVFLGVLTLLALFALTVRRGCGRSPA